MVAREGFIYKQKSTVRHTKCGRMRGMVVGEGGRSSGVLLYSPTPGHNICCSKQSEVVLYSQNQKPKITRLKKNTFS